MTSEQLIGGVLTCLWTGGKWLEGPVVLPDGDVLFSDIPNDRVLRWSRSAGLGVEQHPCGHSNGQTLDNQGRVVRCELSGRCISRTEGACSTTVLADHYHEMRLNSPNDVVVASDDSIWFTDPVASLVESEAPDSDLGDNYVFRLDPGTGLLAVVTDALEEPNGLAFSPDESLLYVTDSAQSVRATWGGAPIFVFDHAGGQLHGAPRLFATIETGIADGIRVDDHGNVFSSSGDGVVAFSAEGDVIGRIDVPEVVTNCCFDVAEHARLYVTGVTSLYAFDFRRPDHGAPRS